MRTWIWLGFISLLASLGTMQCSPRTQTNSELLMAIFPNDSTTIRGIRLGGSVEDVLAQETPNQPIHQDSYGLNYRYTLKDSAWMLISYYPEGMKSDFQPAVNGEGAAKRVVSITANVLLPTEIETARLYSEIQTYFNQLYQVPIGTYGDYVWRSSTRYLDRLEVRLTLDENKKGITLNFTDIKA